MSWFFIEVICFYCKSFTWFCLPLLSGPDWCVCIVVFVVFVSMFWTISDSSSVFWLYGQFRLRWFPLHTKHPCEVPSCFMYAISPSGFLKVVGITVHCFLYVICLNAFLIVGYCL